MARRHGKRTTISCFEGRVSGRSIVLDEGELREARWCPLDRAPEPLGLDARMIWTRGCGLLPSCDRTLDAWI